MALPMAGAAPVASPMAGADPSQPPLGAAPPPQGPQTDPMALMAMLAAMKQKGAAHKRHKGKGKH